MERAEYPQQSCPPAPPHATYLTSSTARRCKGFASDAAVLRGPTHQLAYQAADQSSASHPSSLDEKPSDNSALVWCWPLAAPAPQTSRKSASLQVGANMSGEQHEEAKHLPMQSESDRRHSDLTLIVKGERFYVTKWMMAKYSAVFGDMLASSSLSNAVSSLLRSSASQIVSKGEILRNQLGVLLHAWALSAEQVEQELELDDAPEHVGGLLNHLSPDKDLPVIKQDNLEPLLALADKYQSKIIFDRCEPYLLGHLSIDTALLAQRYGLEKLTAACVEHLTRHDSTMRELMDPKLQKLCCETLYAVYTGALKAKKAYMWKQYGYNHCFAE
eukprot:jgi/Chlat1/1713/Chrsp127S01963